MPARAFVEQRAQHVRLRDAEQPVVRAGQLAVVGVDQPPAVLLQHEPVVLVAAAGQRRPQHAQCVQQGLAARLQDLAAELAVE
jgi:hypothetical protein